MERINQMIQTQASMLASMALTLYVTVQISINFEDVNSSQLLINQMPGHYHQRFEYLSIFLLFLSFVSFGASYYEGLLALTVNKMLCLIGFTSCILLGMFTLYTSRNIGALVSIDDLSNSNQCVFILPQFSQEKLMNSGCASKYLSFAESHEELECSKAERSRVWEDNRQLLVQD